MTYLCQIQDASERGGFPERSGGNLSFLLTILKKLHEKDKMDQRWRRTFLTLPLDLQMVTFIKKPQMHFT